MNYEQIKKDPQRISKIKTYYSQHNWKEMDFPSHKKYWKKFELCNKSLTLNILYVPYNTDKVKHVYNSCMHAYMDTHVQIVSVKVK